MLIMEKLLRPVVIELSFNILITSRLFGIRAMSWGSTGILSCYLFDVRFRSVRKFSPITFSKCWLENNDLPFFGLFCSKDASYVFKLRIGLYLKMILTVSKTLDRLVASIVQRKVSVRKEKELTMKSDCRVAVWETMQYFGPHSL